jgi:hypothetical protein
MGGLASSPEEALIVSVIKTAIEEEGMDWLRCRHGRYWLSMLGIQPEIAWKAAGGEDFKELEKCKHKEEA